MTIPLHRTIIIWLAGLLLCGCAVSQPRRTMNGGAATDKKTQIRNNAISLLYDLVGNEKNVSKILIIKSNSDELGRLIKNISETMGDYQKQLEHMAASNPAELQVMDLPPGEKATRDAIASSKKHELLFSTGKTFAFNLLMTQAEAMNYGSHLAKIAAENSSSSAEVKTFTAMSQRMKNLYGQVVAEMRPGG